ncbi:MAG: tyrosine--tRNA ligase, partial [Planctomycetes bacterium]|nr:tyrosine--tRNA ligase [Planctomycetota bacterium]
ASAIVTGFYGQAAAADAAAQFDRVFRDHKLPSDLPEIALGAADLKDGRISLVRLITTAGFASSNTEARRLTRQGAVTLDGKRLEDPNEDVEVAQGQILKVGKRRFGRIVIG